MAVKSGFIYVLIHPSDSNLVKVGITTRNPEVRLNEHNTQFDKAAGKIVKATGQQWIIKESFAVKDTYNAESAFYDRSPMNMPIFGVGRGGRMEIFTLGGVITWDWVNKGLDVAKSIGIRRNMLQSPNPKPQSKKDSKWIEIKLKDSGLKPLKGFGGIQKVEWKCSKGHIFKLDGRTLVKIPFCPICHPEKYDSYTLNRVELVK